MAALPEPQHTTLRAIEAAVEAKADTGFRAHLGASIIGRPCDRSIWYSFRWATLARHPGRMLRLFGRGQREEDVFAELLRDAGFTVHTIDPRTGEQFRVSAIGGHFGGSMDGAGQGFPESSKWHVLEMKTHNRKSFRDLTKHGVEKSKPEHFAQMQIYMALNGLERAMYLAVCKDDDALHIERVKLRQTEADRLLARARNIITSDRPPAKINDDPAWYQCQFCDHSPTCHANAVPPPTCRTCMHSTAELDGNGRWSCAVRERDLTEAEQIAGCPEHNYTPDLLANWAEVTDAIGRNVEYRNKLNGSHFLNGPGEDIGAEAYSSVEIYKARDARVIGAPETDALKREFAAEVTG